MKHNLKYLMIASCALAAALALCFVILAWTEPGSAPPQGNVSAPLNTGDVAQTKTGALTIGGRLTVNNDATAQKFCLADVCCATWEQCSEYGTGVGGDPGSPFKPFGPYVVDGTPSCSSGQRAAPVSATYNFLGMLTDITYGCCPESTCQDSNLCIPENYPRYNTADDCNSTLMGFPVSLDCAKFLNADGLWEKICRAGTWKVRNGFSCSPSQGVDCDKGICDAINSSSGIGTCSYLTCVTDGNCGSSAKWCDAGVCCTSSTCNVNDQCLHENASMICVNKQWVPNCTLSGNTCAPPTPYCNTTTKVCEACPVNGCTAENQKICIGKTQYTCKKDTASGCFLLQSPKSCWFTCSPTSCF